VIGGGEKGHTPSRRKNDETYRKVQRENAMEGAWKERVCSSGSLVRLGRGGVTTRNGRVGTCEIEGNPEWKRKETCVSSGARPGGGMSRRGLAAPTHWGSEYKKKGEFLGYPRSIKKEEGGRVKE